MVRRADLLRLQPGIGHWGGFEVTDLLPIDTPIAWTFPGTDHIYRGIVVEQHPPKKSGDEERYRVKGNQFDCFAFRRDLKTHEEAKGLGKASGGI